MSKVDLALVDWYSALPRLGVDSSYLNSRKKKGPCPVCEAETGQAGKTRFMFIDKTGKGDWYCHAGNGGAGHGGDAVEMLMQINNWDFKTVIKELGGETSSGKKIEYKTSDNLKANAIDESENNCKKLKKVWHEAEPIKEGDAAWLYLNNRVPGMTDIPDSSVMRLHKGLDYWDVAVVDGKDKFTKLGNFPAIVSLIRKNNKPVSIHRTFITLDGFKADVPSAKKIMSGIEGISGGVIKLYPIHSNVLAVSEGIEKSLAIRIAYKNEMSVWSLINASVLKNFVPPKGVTELHIFGDSDPSGKQSAEALQCKCVALGLKVVMHFTNSEEKDFDDIWKEFYDLKKLKVA